MQMNIAEAKAKLSELVAAAERGEDVILARGGHPVARITSMAVPAGLRFGPLKGLVPDFTEPMSDDELREWDAI
jgi:prevent-host-death family protein